MSKQRNNYCENLLFL